LGLAQLSAAGTGIGGGGVVVLGEQYAGEHPQGLQAAVTGERDRRRAPAAPAEEGDETAVEAVLEGGTERGAGHGATVEQQRPARWVIPTHRPLPAPRRGPESLPPRRRCGVRRQSARVVALYVLGVARAAALLLHDDR